MDCPQGEKWPLKRGGHCKEVETRFSVWTISQEKKNGRCREVAVVKRLKQDSVYGPYPPRKKTTIVEG